MLYIYNYYNNFLNIIQLWSIFIVFLYYLFLFFIHILLKKKKVQRFPVKSNARASTALGPLLADNRVEKSHLPNVIKLIFSEGTPWKKEREEAGNGLMIFPVSGSRIPKISDFCEKMRGPYADLAAYFICTGLCIKRVL